MLRLLLLLLFLIGFSFAGYTQKAFDCANQTFFTYNQDVFTTLFSLEEKENGWISTQIGDSQPYTINAIGFNQIDRLIYGIDPVNHSLCQIDADGTVFVQKFLDLNGNVFAGDVSPDGRYYYCLNKHFLFKVDLFSEGYDLQAFELKSKEYSAFFITDIAVSFDGKQIFGYDGQHSKLSTIDPNTGWVEQNYPSTNFAQNVPALFFDDKGKLFGIITDNEKKESKIIEFNLKTGDFSSAHFDEFIGERDACSCYSPLGLYSITPQEFVFPCTEIEIDYVLRISTSNFGVVHLLDSFPEGFKVVEVKSPFGGDYGNSLGNNFLNLENLSLTRAIDTISIKIKIPEGFEGVFASKCRLELEGGNNLDGYDFFELEHVSSKIKVISLDNDLALSELNTTIFLCDEDTYEVDYPICGGMTLEWSDDGSNEEMHTFYDQGIYDLKIMTSCDTILKSYHVEKSEIEIDVQSIFEANSGDHIFVEPSISSSQEILNVSWELNGEFICDNCMSFDFIAKENSTIAINVLDINGCEYTKYIEVFIHSDIIAPTVFSPNLDGVNDLFSFYYSNNDLVHIHLKVLDRWGEIVYFDDFKDIEMGWDGKTNQGINLPIGVYIWVAEFQFLQKKVSKKGVITLLR